MDSTFLTLCMIVKNEERTLGRCLDSVRGLAGEIIIVDTGSTDATAAIAARYGATVAPFDFAVVHFAAARNYALERARGHWILALDADETLNPEDAPLILEAISRGDNAGYYFERLNRQPDGKPALSDYVVRLFPRRPDYRYRGRVHETVDHSILAAGGRLLRTGIRLNHDFASDPQARRRRNLWYIEILKEEIAADPSDCSRLDFLAAEYHQLGLFDQAAEVAERIVTAKPLDAEAHLNAGVYHLIYQQDRQRAYIDFTNALRLRPAYPEALSFLQSMLQERELSHAGPR